MAWEGSSKPRRAGVWQWTRQCICTTPAGPTPRWGTARRKRRTAWRHESMQASKVRGSKTGLASRRHCAASRLRSGSRTRLRSAAKRRNQPPETTQENTRHTVKFKPGLDLPPRLCVGKEGKLRLAGHPGFLHRGTQIGGGAEGLGAGQIVDLEYNPHIVTALGVAQQAALFQSNPVPGWAVPIVRRLPLLEVLHLMSNQ